jgi:LuxR family transcriptional regulator, maltose regulon positive regulatory protein
VCRSAPAGYGKTTVLRQWAAGSERSFAWVTLGVTDDDPIQLAAHIALALEQGTMPTNGARGPATTNDHGGDPGLPHLLTALRRLRRPAVLVLDDLHEVRGRQSLALLRGLVEAAPAGVHLVAAARGRPALAAPALQAEISWSEFGREDLSFSENETRQVLTAAGLQASPGAVRLVLRRTEGWPAGVYLAALAAREGSSDEPDGAGAGTITGEDLYIADYFRDELLSRESAENVRFLLRTSVLDEMSGPLCDAVLARTDSAARLAEAERRGLFLVGLNHRGGWYRYHRLFGEMLVSELCRREPGEEFRLHRRAAGWYERERQPEQAIAHALASRDPFTAAPLIDSWAREFLDAGRRDTVQAWLRTLSEEALTAYPPLAISAAWVWALSGHPVQAQRCLRAARAASLAGPLPDGSSSLESAVAVLSALLAPLGVDRMLQDARTAVRLERPGAPRRPLALVTLGIARMLTGDPKLAVTDLTLAAEIGRQGPVSAALAQAQLALLMLERDDATADAHARVSLELVEESGLHHNVLAMLAYAVSAWTAARRGDQEAARRYAGAAQRLGADPTPAAFPWYGAQVAVALGRTSLLLGDAVAARSRVDEARQHLSHLLTEGALRAKVEDLSERLAGSGARERLRSAMSLTAAEVRVLQLLPTHLSLAEIAEQLHVTRNTVKTQVSATYRKLQADTRAAAVNRGRELGLIEP